MKIESIVQPISHQLSPDNTLSDAAQSLEDAGKTAVPVINDDGTLLGLITKQELEATTANAGGQAHAVAELAKPLDVTCTLSDEILTVANQAASQGQSHAAVVDERENLIGIADLSPYQTGTSDAQHGEDALDEALDETFPASDPISP